LPIKDWLRGLEAYSPPSGEGIEVVLDLNESPWPPPESVIEAIVRALRSSNRYPRREDVEPVREALAEYAGVEPRHVVIGLGGDMVIEKAFQLVVRPGDAVVLPESCFSMYPFYARVNGARVAGVTLSERGEEWVLDWQLLLEIVKRERPSLVGIDNPNNPTGSIIVPGEGELVELLENAMRRRVLVVLDEAYYEFSNVTYVGLTEAYPNLLIIRTLSKAFSLAGLRVGYGIAHPELVAKLESLMPPFLPKPSLYAARAAIEDRGYVRRVVEVIVSEREWLRERLKMLGLKTYRSSTNFVSFKPGIDNLEEKLRERRIAVKSFRIGDYKIVRATVGKPRDNSMLVNALREVLESG